MKKMSLLIQVLLLGQLAFAPIEPARAGNTWYVSPTGSWNIMHPGCTL